MKAIAFVSVVLALCAALSGCNGREQMLIGKWNGEITVPESEKNDPSAKMAMAMLKNITLELKEDKTFVMMMMFPIEGTWSVSGDRVSLKVEKFMGMTVYEMKKKSAGNGGAPGMDKMDKPLELTISADNQTLTAVPDKQDQKGQLQFTKAG